MWDPYSEWQAVGGSLPKSKLKKQLYTAGVDGNQKSGEKTTWNGAKTLQIMVDFQLPTSTDEFTGFLVAINSSMDPKKMMPWDVSRGVSHPITYSLFL